MGNVEKSFESNSERTIEITTKEQGTHDTRLVPTEKEGVYTVEDSPFGTTFVDVAEHDEAKQIEVSPFDSC